MKKTKFFPVSSALVLLVLPTFLFFVCSCNNESAKVIDDGTTTNDFSRLYAKMYNVTAVDTSGSTNVIIKTMNVPDHKSPFFGVGHAKYEVYNGDNPKFSTKINLRGAISDPTLLGRAATFTLSRKPTQSSSHASTTGGAMGIARNGVIYFNQYNGVGSALDELEIDNADQYLGHPTPTNAGAEYHYHYEPKYLTTKFGNSSFLGFLLDGFPVYGPYENDIKITTDMLDVYHGHVGATEDYPNDKIYHYHVVSASSSVYSVLKTAAPYINGGKYYGKKGTVN
jgi:hypothetical protein